MSDYHVFAVVFLDYIHGRRSQNSTEQRDELGEWHPLRSRFHHPLPSL